MIRTLTETSAGESERSDGCVIRPVIEPLAVDAKQAAGLLGLSRSMFFKMVDAGRIGPTGRRFGKCVRYGLDELRAWTSAGMPPRHEWQNRRDNHPGS